LIEQPPGKNRSRVDVLFPLKVMAVQEEERKRIARELHDETSQTLTALLMKLEGIACDEAQKRSAALDSAVELAERAVLNFYLQCTPPCILLPVSCIALRVSRASVVNLP
jgi:hypothetical protein